MSCNPMNPMLRRTLFHRGGEMGWGRGGLQNVLQSHESDAAAHCPTEKGLKGEGGRTCCNPMNPIMRRILVHRERCGKAAPPKCVAIP